MIRGLRVTVLAENTAGHPDVLAEHGMAFWIEADGRHLLFDTGQGMVIPLGCAHSGVVNTLEAIAAMRGHDRFHAVLGGMHLLRASEERLVRTGDALDRFGVQLLGPCHCTGAGALR